MIEFEHGTDGVRCPGCGGSYLHQRKVVVLDCSEYKRTVVRTTCESESARSENINKETNGYSSVMRQGVEITFDCEQCPATPTLEISQYKGNTLIDWKTLPPPR